jgi:hypothetical protein
MHQIMRQFNYSIFFLPLFFVLHAVNEHYGLIPFYIASKFLIAYLILSFVLLLIGKRFFRSFEKGGIWTFGLLVIFYFFGAARDFLKELRIPSFVISYSFILPLLLVLFILFTAIIKKRMESFKKTVFFLNILFSMFVLIELVSLFTSIITNKESRLRLSGSSKAAIDELSQVKEGSKPDIFFIVFDEYASSESLKKYSNFDNSSLDSTLLSKGFYVAAGSKSNYNATSPSIAATLNMNYHDQPLEGKTHDVDLILRSCKQIRFSVVPELLHKAGYNIKNFGLFDLKSKRVLTTTYFSHYYEDLINLQTFWGRIKRDIWWNIEVRLHKNAERKNIEKEVERNTINFKETINELKTEEATPKFIYSHIMMPHSPFFFNKNGTPLENALYTFDHLDIDTLYLNQLIYTNTWIREIIESIPLGRKRPLVVIIQGDHGFRSDLPILIRERQFMNLNAFYFDDKAYTLLHNSISPVNTFRVIFNKYFHANIPLLRDSTIFLK